MFRNKELSFHILSNISKWMDVFTFLFGNIKYVHDRFFRSCKSKCNYLFESTFRLEVVPRHHYSAVSLVIFRYYVNNSYVLDYAKLLVNTIVIKTNVNRNKMLYHKPGLMLHLMLICYI